MPRTGAGTKTNRTDLLAKKPAVKSPGQPNGRPTQAAVATGLPYGEHKELVGGIQQTAKSPAFRGRAVPPPPTAEDLRSGPGNDRVQSALAGRTRAPVPGLFDPNPDPTEDLMSGSIGRPDSVLGPPQAGNLADSLQQVAMMTGSAGLAQLAARVADSGT